MAKMFKSVVPSQNFVRQSSGLGVLKIPQRQSSFSFLLAAFHPVFFAFITF
jgi:hypothetical protein